MKPIYKQIPYDSPLTYFSAFTKQDSALLLDSSQSHPEWGRYSFIAVSPWSIITSKNHLVWVDDHLQPCNDPFQVIKELEGLHKLESLPDLPPFQGGVAGLFGYDLSQHLERLPNPEHDSLDFPDMILGLYDLVIAFDIIEKKAWIISSGLPEQNESNRINRARQRLEWLHSLLLETKESSRFIDWLPVEVEAENTVDSYLPKVEQVINYIYSGDIYQANLSQRFQATLPPGYTAWNLYLRLREINPAPFSAYLNYKSYTVVSASPERFIKTQHQEVETKPIKGTRKRHSDPILDNEIAEELLKSEKDQAENIMIVDLLRNDLSKVCQPNSIKVPKLLNLESFATVHHLVSTIQGKLLPEKTCVDLLTATFPGGSITGAPKIRAMEIITELEKQRRGPYCGSIGYIGFDQSMDTNILIRTYAINGDMITYNVGGGIVADSEPLAEFEETLTKGAALKRALSA